MLSDVGYRAGFVQTKEMKWRTRDELKDEVAPPPLAAYRGEKNKAQQKVYEGGRKKKSNEYAQKKVIP